MSSVFPPTVPPGSAPVSTPAIPDPDDPAAAPERPAEERAFPAWLYWAIPLAILLLVAAVLGYNSYRSNELAKAKLADDQAKAIAAAADAAAHAKAAYERGDVALEMPFQAAFDAVYIKGSTPPLVKDPIVATFGPPKTGEKGVIIFETPLVKEYARYFALETRRGVALFTWVGGDDPRAGNGKWVYTGYAEGKALRDVILSETPKPEAKAAAAATAPPVPAPAAAKQPKAAPRKKAAAVAPPCNCPRDGKLAKK